MSYLSKFGKDYDAIRASYPAHWQVPSILDERFRCLEAQNKNVTSQFGEDGLIAKIFSIIGVKFSTCFEVGASDGVFFSNTRALRMAGWSGVLVESDTDDYAAMRNHPDGQGAKGTTIVMRNAFLSWDFGIDRCMKDFENYDLGVIDTDGDDIGHWQRMVELRPRVIVIECAERESGAAAQQNGKEICKYCNDAWTGPRADDEVLRAQILKQFKKQYKQAIPAELIALGKEKKYTAVARTYCNMIFVANEDLPKEKAHDYGEKLIVSPDIHKESKKETYEPSIAATISRPREGSLDASDCIHRALGAYGIPWNPYHGPFWEQGIAKCFESAIKADTEILITFDYDSFFTPEDFDTMLQTFLQNEQMDALSCLQPSRHGQEMLFSIGGKKGWENLKIGTVIPVDTAHFGMTFIRMRGFKKMKRPWLLGVPNEEGKWEGPTKEGDPRIDYDCYFWRKWRASGNNLFLHTGVWLGHMVRHVKQFGVFPDPITGEPKGRTVHYDMNEWLGGNRDPIETRGWHTGESTDKPKEKPPREQYDAQSVCDYKRTDFSADKYPQMFKGCATSVLGEPSRNMAGSKFCNVED